MGCLAGVMEAQYNLLRKHGHSPSEAFNETVEELTQSLIRLVAENGMDWMFANCSTTAQRGALDWAPRFRDAVAPVFDELYESVVTGKETRRVLEANSAPDYRETAKGAGCHPRIRNVAGRRRGAVPAAGKQAQLRPACRLSANHKTMEFVMAPILLYDTTLRDGTQGENINFSAEEKLKIAKRLDDFGIHYIEGGWPGSNPRDMQFFELAASVDFHNARLTAFGSTRRPGIAPQDDANVSGPD